MPRPAKGPRLYRRERAGREPVWVILDGPRERLAGRGADGLAAAEKAFATYLAEKYRPPTQAGLGLDDILVSDVIAAYLRERGPHVANPEFIAATAAPVLEHFAGRTLAEVKGQACRDYVEWRTSQVAHPRSAPARLSGNKKISAATARHDLKTLRAAINHWHAEHGPLPAVPTVTLPPAPPPRERWLTRDEAAMALRAARASRYGRHLARLILIGLYTGTRPGAILRLSWLPQVRGGHIDLEAGVLHRQGPGDARSRKRQTPVKLPPRLAAHLDRWRRMDLAGEGTGRKPRPVTARVVHYFGRPVTKLRRSFANAMRDAGLGADVSGSDPARSAAVAGRENVTPHTLRHTAATWLMQSGVDIAGAAGFLGMSVQTLEDVYGHHHPDFQAAAANARRGARERTGAERAQETPGKPPSTTVTRRPRPSPNALDRKHNAS